MGYIKLMLEALKNGKRVRITDYYTNPFKFYDDLEIYALLNLDNKELQRELTILANTVKEINNAKVFYLDEPLPIEKDNTYKIIFQQLLRLYLKDKQSAYDEALKYKNAAREFNRLINDFKKEYINADLFVDQLLDMSNYIKDHEPTLSNNKIKKKSFTEELLEKIQASNLSFIDYSFYNYLGDDFNKAVYRDINKNNPLFKEISSREDTTIPQILDIIEKIRNKEITILEYYETTKLHPMFLTMIANKYGKISNNYREFIKHFNSYSVKAENKKNEKLKIKDVEVDEQLVDKAFEYLESIQAPATQATYMATIRKLIRK